MGMTKLKTTNDAIELAIALAPGAMAKEALALPPRLVEIARRTQRAASRGKARLSTGVQRATLKPRQGYARGKGLLYYYAGRAPEGPTGMLMQAVGDVAERGGRLGGVGLRRKLKRMGLTRKYPRLRAIGTGRMSKRMAGVLRGSTGGLGEEHLDIIQDALMGPLMM